MIIQFIGCWKMWEAILNSFVQSWFDTQNIFIEDRNWETKLNIQRKYNTQLWINKESDIIVLAIKPQQLQDIDFDIFQTNTTILSILWWVNINRLKEVSKKQNIIRCMPNLPITIWEWIIWYTKSWNINKNIIDAVEDAFKKSWYFIELKNEEDIDRLTIISGSWPAYFAYITEKLIKKAKNMWFNEDIANKLAINTFIWSAKLIEQSNISPKKFRENVSSKWWITQEVISTWERWNFENILSDWLDNGIKKAKELNWE